MSARPLFVGMLASASLIGCTAKQQPSTGGSARATLDAYVAAWNRHDSAAFDTLLTADAVHEDVSSGLTFKGPPAVKGFMRQLISMEPDYDWHITKVTESGPNVAAEWTWTSTFTGPSPIGPVTNKHISGRGASIVEVENGKIKQFTDYYDEASFFRKPATDSTKK